MTPPPASKRTLLFPPPPEQDAGDISPRLLPARCDRCNLPPHLCLCAEIPRVETRTHFLLLQHEVETRKKSNTGRLATLALVNSRLLTHGAPAEPFDTALLSEPGTWLL